MSTELMFPLSGASRIVVTVDVDATLFTLKMDEYPVPWRLSPGLGGVALGDG